MGQLGLARAPQPSSTFTEAEGVSHPKFYDHPNRPKEWITADAILFGNPRCGNCLRWLKEIPNEGLIRSTSIDGTECILVTKPQTLAEVLVHRSYEFEKPYILRRFLARFLGWGIIVQEGDQHKLQRKTLMPSFHMRNIKELYPLMWEKSCTLTDILAREIRNSPEYPKADEKGRDWIGVIDICDWTSRLTLDIIGPTAMGRDFRSLQNNNDLVATNYVELTQPTTRRLLHFAFSMAVPASFAESVPTPLNAAINRIVSSIRGVCLDVIQQKKQELLSDKDASSFDILSTMIKGMEISDEVCVNQMLTLLAAGHETTANTLAWACYRLCKHPLIQSALRAELRATIPDPSTGAPTAADLESLPLLNGVCNEILRLYPTVPVTVREVMSPTVIAGTRLAEGTWLMLSPYATNRDPSLWGPDSEEFKPERWIDEVEQEEGGGDGNSSAKSRRPNNHGGASSNYAMLTFIHGPRSCIGQGFARAELRCAVAAIVGRFAMSLQNPHEEVKVGGSITTKPKNGLKLRLTLLESWCEEV